MKKEPDELSTKVLINAVIECASMEMKTEGAAKSYWEAERKRYKDELESRCVKYQPINKPEDVTNEMLTAGKEEWDAAHKEGIRKWTEMFSRVYLAMSHMAPKIKD